MISKRGWFVGTGLLSSSVLMLPALSGEDLAAAQEQKPTVITRLYTGPDGQTHAEEIEARFAPVGGTDVYNLMANSGAELGRAPPGRVSDWHTAPVANT
jgi:hypothetical protein